MVHGMKQLTLLILLIFFLGLADLGYAQIVQKLSGIAVSVDLKLQRLEVSFEHPVTGENTLKVFQIEPGTGFKNTKRLDQIKPNDPVSIDYQEAAGNELTAIYVEVIPLNTVPFTREQVTKKLRFFN